MKLKFLPFLLLGLMFTGCAGKAVDLSGDWKVTALIIDGVSQPVVENSLAITQKGNKLNFAGNSGVNTIQGDVTVSKDGKFTAGDKFMQTKMMGSPEEQLFEDTYVQALMDADSYEYDAEKNLLKIFDSKNKVEIQLSK